MKIRTLIEDQAVEEISTAVEKADAIRREVGALHAPHAELQVRAAEARAEDVLWLGTIASRVVTDAAKAPRHRREVLRSLAGAARQALGQARGAASAARRAARRVN